jgi:hypothetical protein
MNRLGRSAALGLCLLGVIYAVTVAIGMSWAGLDKPIRGPILATMEALTLISAPLLVLMMAAVDASAPARNKAFSSAALGFAILVAGLTGVVHFVGLTALRQVGEQGIEWPSPLYAVELLAWDVFLGLSLLCAAPVFDGGGFSRSVRTALVITGSLCLAGTLGPLTGHMRLQFIGVFGYGTLLPVTCFLLARHFRHESQQDRM